MKEYMTTYGQGNDSVDNVMKRFTNNLSALLKEGWEPIGNPSIALGQGAMVTVLIMSREKPEMNNEQATTQKTIEEE